MEASEGASTEEALEGGGYGGSARFLGDTLVGSRLGTRRGGVLKAGQLQSGRRCQKARRAARGRPRLAIAAFCTGNCSGFHSLCLFFLSIFTLFFILAGRLKGKEEIGVPRFDTYELGTGRG